MHKWYAPGRFLLVAALALPLTGCAATSRTIGKWTGRDQAEEKLADVDAKASKSKSSDARIPESASKSKKATDKPDKVVAESKPNSKSGETKAATKPTDTKVADSKSTSAKSPGGDVKAATKTAAKPEKPAETEVAVADVPKAQIKGMAPKSEPVASSVPTKEKSLPKPSLSRDPFLDEAVAAAERQTPEREAENAAAPFPEAAMNVAKASPKLSPQEELPVNPFEEVQQTSATAGLPEWALGEELKSESPTWKIDQTSIEVLPGQMKQSQPSRAPQASTPLAPSTKMAALCPEARGEVAELVRALDSADPEVVKQAIHRLGRMQSAALAATPALRALTHSRDGFVRVHAALALVRMQQVSQEVSQTLMAGLRSPDPAVRSFSAAVLTELGPQSIATLPALVIALQDEDGYVRLHVAEVLIRHEQWSYQALHTLLGCLKDRDENIRWLATYSLAELAPQSPEAVQALALTLRDPSAKVRIGAAYALGEIGQMSSAASSDLERCKLSDDAELRTAAAYALQQIQF